MINIQDVIYSLILGYILWCIISFYVAYNKLKFAVNNINYFGNEILKYKHNPKVYEFNYLTWLDMKEIYEKYYIQYFKETFFCLIFFINQKITIKNILFYSLINFNFKNDKLINIMIKKGEDGLIEMCDELLNDLENKDTKE